MGPVWDVLDKLANIVKSCQFSLEQTLDFCWWDEIPNYKIDRHIAKKGLDLLLSLIVAL